MQDMHVWVKTHDDNTQMKSACDFIAVDRQCDFLSSLWDEVYLLAPPSSTQHD